MKHVTLDALYTKYFTTHVHVSAKEQWRDGEKWGFVKSGRLGSVLLYINACDVVYSLGNEILLTAKPGDFLYIPTGARYVCTFSNCDPSAEYQGLKIEFEMHDESGELLAFSDKIIKINEVCPPDALRRFEDIHRLASMPEKPTACINSQNNLLIHSMSLLSRQQNQRKSRFSGIEKGIEYMERDPDQLLNIAEVAALCSVSTSCFNRLFKEYSGITPVEYRYSKKIEQAKVMLMTGAVTVKAIAYALGFETPSYFCRMFKRKTGMTPKEYQAQYLNENRK